MKAAVFCRNMGMSGTCSMVMTAAARLAASWWASAKVSAVAKTSIMGMAMLLLSCHRRRGGVGRGLDELGHFVGVGDYLAFQDAYSNCASFGSVECRWEPGL